MASFLDVCRFTAVSSGTGDFVVSALVTGYQTPATAGAVNGAIYRYRAENAALTEWEVGFGAYTVGSVTLARTTVLFNSLGTTAKISFTAPPQVGVVALAEDLTVTQPAAKSDQTTGTSNILAVTPLHQQDHDSAAKAWVFFTGATPPVVLASYNISSVTRTSAGIFVVNFTTAFSSVNYAILATTQSSTATAITALVNGAAANAGNCTIVTLNQAGAVTDPTIGVHVACYGRQ